ncbi:hypothetical protein CBS101457_006761 [Exobasidium rhododendri]|nr:hypothetical protein CBS101457_006761 [Exobasidium rhododendri]
MWAGLFLISSQVVLAAALPVLTSHDNTSPTESRPCSISSIKEAVDSQASSAVDATKLEVSRYKNTRKKAIKSLSHSKAAYAVWAKRKAGVLSSAMKGKNETAEPGKSGRDPKMMHREDLLPLSSQGHPFQLYPDGKTLLSIIADVRLRSLEDMRSRVARGQRMSIAIGPSFVINIKQRLRCAKVAIDRVAMEIHLLKLAKELGVIDQATYDRKMRNTFYNHGEASSSSSDHDGITLGAVKDRESPRPSSSHSHYASDPPSVDEDRRAKSERIPGMASLSSNSAVENLSLSSPPQQHDRSIEGELDDLFIEHQLDYQGSFPSLRLHHGAPDEYFTSHLLHQPLPGSPQFGSGDNEEAYRRIKSVRDC